MARLIAIPIQDRGDAVLIVTHRDGVTLMGFVANATLGRLFEHRPSSCDCMAFVERHLQSFENILLRKSMDATFVETSIACVEIEPADLVGSGLPRARA